MPGTTESPQLHYLPELLDLIRISVKVLNITDYQKILFINALKVNCNAIFN